MNGGVEPTSADMGEPDAADSRPETVGQHSGGQHSDWIAPEGDDWLSSIYRELTAESAPTTPDGPGYELGHWFG
ncbi:MAG: hypothetical protein ABSG37_13415 [Candidatus Limnocylindrales bacterium]|jgi:hypothetical protein